MDNYFFIAPSDCKKDYFRFEPETYKAIYFVVAQLVEGSLPSQDIHGSVSVIAQFYSYGEFSFIFGHIKQILLLEW